MSDKNIGKQASTLDLLTDIFLRLTYTPKNGHSFINLLFHTHQVIYSPKLNESVYDYKTLQCI
jgi:hypothetical protein